MPLSVTRTYVKSVEVGRYPRARRAFQVTRCNQCENAPCVAACPTAAMYRRDDGIVDFDKSSCIGCKACIAACPYDAIFIIPDDHSAEKCNFCAHRVDIGLEPACVVVCPTEALIVGDMNDPLSEVSRIVHQNLSRCAGRRRRPGEGSLQGRGSRNAGSTCRAATRGGLFMWSEQDDGTGKVPSGTRPAKQFRGGAAQLRRPARDPVGLPGESLHLHQVDRRRGLPGAAAAGGRGDGPLDIAGVTLVGPLVALAFLVLTGALLVWDLEHPKRFWMVLAKPQWALAGAWRLRDHRVRHAVGRPRRRGCGRPARLDAGTGWAGGPLAVAVAVYTAYLLAQARARDLWQSPLLPRTSSSRRCWRGRAP